MVTLPSPSIVSNSTYGEDNGQEKPLFQHPEDPQVVLSRAKQRMRNAAQVVYGTSAKNDAGACRVD